MNFLSTYSEYRSQLVEGFQFNGEQISENLRIFESPDFNEELFEHWWNTLFDFGALIPGIGSFFEGINLVSYAKQGEYLLAGLCAIGLIPVFGQYIGAGGSLLVKALKGGGKITGKILSPVAKLVGKFFPKISAFFKSSSFLSKFKGIGKYTDKMLVSLKEFSASGKATGALGKFANAGFRREFKGMTKVGEWFIPGGKAEHAEKAFAMDSRVAATAEENWNDFLKSVPVQGA
jgi:hypothetical protein